MTKEWEKLTPYAQIRQRAEMYFGSRDPHTQEVLEYTGNGTKITETTWVPAVFTCFREILDNSLDEVISHGRGKRIDVTYDPATMTVMVADDGRGMPIEWSEEHGAYAATILLSQIMSGRNFVADRGEARGLNGIGAKGVNFCSEWFHVEVTRGKQQFGQQFSEGEQLQIAPANIWPTNSKKTGTAIRFKLSPKVFPNLTLPENFIAARMQEIANCYPKLHLTYNGKKVTGKDPETLFGERKPILFEINEQGFRARFWLVPEFVPDGDFAYSMVNGIPLFNNGAHMDAFRRGFHTGLLAAMEKESKRRKLIPNRADISEGLLIYAMLEMSNPSFDSQAKTRLINEQVGTLVRKTLEAENFYKDLIRKNPEWIDSIYARCATRTQAKDEKETAKQAKKNLRQKIEDLEDACGHDRSKCVLFITEGKCLHRDTEIKVVSGSGFEDRKIKDVEVGDLVLTHSNCVRPIVAKWSRTINGLCFNTPIGSVIASPEHRFLVADRQTKELAWIDSAHIKSDRHQLVRAKLSGMSHLEEIWNIEKHEGYFCILHGNSDHARKNSRIQEYESLVVFDLHSMSFQRINVVDLDADRYAMVIMK